MFCKECGMKHPTYTNYCPNDGQDMQQVIPSPVEHRTAGFCASCGNTVEIAAQYCRHCGESHSTMKLGNVKKSPIAQVQQQPFKMPTLSSGMTSKKSLTSILMAVGLSILLTLVAAFIIKSQAENFIIENSDGEISKSDIKQVEFLSEMINDATGMEIDFPNIYNMFTYVSLLHGVDFELSGEVSAEEDGEFYKADAELNVQNITLSFLFIIGIILIIGGLFLGYLVKRNGLSLGESVLGFSVLYGIFLLISSLIASFTFKKQIDVFYTEVDLKMKGSFPLIESFIVGAILAASIAGLAALVMVYGKDVVAYVQTKATYVQYLVYSTLISLVGITIFTGIYFSISGKYFEGELMTEQTTSLGTLFAGPMGLWGWNLSHLIPLNFTSFDNGNEYFSLHLFSSVKSLSELEDLSIYEMVSTLFFIEDGLPLLLKASILIPVLILILAGFFLYRTHGLHLIELLKFSAIYGIVMTFTRIFSSIEISTEVGGDEVFDIGQFMMQIQPNLIPVFIISTLFALAFISIGGYLKRYVGENA
ncbi:hypothetical protein [Paenisporosarcina indica]|uniref:hypothetical protein n=1 Tax=Paenisporosarcina indica TaxID=650093 RepID=UPI00094FDD1D|nr:hypothetical protein [Paenisporosarcina indica]